MTPFIELSISECVAIALCWVASGFMVARLFKNTDEAGE